MRSVLLIGFGAIGRHVATLLAPELARGEITLTAVVRDLRRHQEDRNPEVRLAEVEGPDSAPWPELASAADVIVECAGVPAAKAFGPAVIASGTALVLTSVGALADATTRRGLLAGPGRLHVTNGAIGGLDVLEAAAQAGGLDQISITTSKAPRGLIQPWMSAAEAERLRDLGPASGPVSIFTGDPAEAIAKFPGNVNIAVALAWATRGLAGGTSSAADDDALMERALRSVAVELRADPAAAESVHLISARGTAGEFDFSIRSTPSPENPATSGQTAMSVARTLRSCLQG